jgi:hypothetical protein
MSNQYLFKINAEVRETPKVLSKPPYELQNSYYNYKEKLFHKLDYIYQFKIQ